MHLSENTGAEQISELSSQIYDCWCEMPSLSTHNRTLYISEDLLFYVSNETE